MKSKLSDRNCISGITHALRWLYGNRPGTDASVLLHARRHGLVSHVKKQQWECDSFLLLRLLKKQARTGPLPLNGAALAGIGEMQARTHIDKLEAEKASIGILKRLSKNPGAYKNCLKEAIISATAKHSEKKRSGSNTYSVPVSNFNDWKETRLAFTLAQRCSEDSTRREYALSFLSRLILVYRPEHMARFAAEVASRVPINTIAGAVAKLSGFYPRLADAAMRTAVPVLVMTGAFSLGIELGWRSKMPLPLLVCRLKELRIPPEGVMRICMQLLNEARIEVRRSKQGIKDAQIRVRELTYRPHMTDYPASNIPDVLAREQKMLEERQKKFQKSEDDFTLALKATAEISENPEKAWEILESIYLQDAEYICRFALAHEGDIRIFMLGKVLSIFSKQLTSQDSWSFINDDFSTYWYAKAQNALSLETQTDAGHAAGKRIGAIEEVLREQVQAPFAVMRNENFTNDLKLWAKLLDFAFHVSLSFEKVYKTLLGHALHSARAFFPIASRSLNNDIQLLKVVATHSANALLEYPEEKARAWLNDPLLPDIIKAYVIWSYPALLADNQQAAFALAKNLKHGYPDESESLNALTCLIDQAFIANASTPVSDIVKAGLIWLWELLPDKGDYAFLSSLSADIILAALTGQDNAKKQVKNHHFWGHSRIGLSIV